MTRKVLLVLGDQLTRQVGPLSTAQPDDFDVLMIESRGILEALPHHAQKLTLVLSAMRHFARELEQDGFHVSYVRHDHPEVAAFASGVAWYAKTFAPSSLHLMTPNDHGVLEPIEAACQSMGLDLHVHPNDLWVTPNDLFDQWREGRKTLRLEYFYREARRATGILMEDDGTPAGGQWNYDAENRASPDLSLTPPEVPTFEPDPITSEVQDEIRAHFPHVWGDLEPFGWPVTRKDALATLDAFLRDRFQNFGTYQDAIVIGETTLWHSTLSVPLNLGLLHPREVLDAAVSHAESVRGTPDEIPINSLEGFVRQILGWREFMHHVYRTDGAALREANVLEAHAPVPPAFWEAATSLNCLSTTVDQLKRTGYTHHIQRLMILGNIAQLLGVHPKALLEWFTATHVDALDWVMVPNVMAMSQYADGGMLTSKPYAAGANYIHRMSNACASCRFNPKVREGDDACPITDWYWAFIDKHQDRFASNQRMRMIVSSWRKRDSEGKARVASRSASSMESLQSGQL